MDDREFFEKFVIGHMCADIQREIDLRRAGQSAGSFLCALGLLSYTEYMGEWEIRPANSFTAKFNTFFRRMGPLYASLLDQGVDVYRDFRCGLAHYYAVKHSTSIYMLNEDGEQGPMIVFAPAGSGVSDSSVPRPVDVGIGRAPNGAYFFVVEKYLEDFKAACLGLLAERLNAQPQVGVYIRPTTRSSG
jgi:hypothetical protein